MLAVYFHYFAQKRVLAYYRLIGNQFLIKNKIFSLVIVENKTFYAIYKHIKIIMISNDVIMNSIKTKNSLISKKKNQFHIIKKRNIN